MAFIKCSGDGSKYKTGIGPYADNGTVTVYMHYHPNEFVQTWMGKESGSDSSGYYTTAARTSLLININGTWKRSVAATGQSEDSYTKYQIQLPPTSELSTFTSFNFKWDGYITGGRIHWVAL